LNNPIQLEDKVSCSRSKHEGEPSTGNLRQAYGRTRGSSQRQLPTDHDYAVSTREYQLDQSSPLPATAAADPVLVRKKRPAHLDRSLHINFCVGGHTTGMLSHSGSPIPHVLVFGTLSTRLASRFLSSSRLASQSRTASSCTPCFFNQCAAKQSSSRIIPSSRCSVPIRSSPSRYDSSAEAGQHSASPPDRWGAFREAMCALQFACGSIRQTQPNGENDR
jgi:hypothetical protein